MCAGLQGGFCIQVASSACRLEIDFGGKYLLVGYFHLVAIAQFTILSKAFPNMHGMKSSKSTLFLTERPELHSKLWSWVSCSFLTIWSRSLMVLCDAMFIGASTMPGKSQILLRGRGRPYSWMTSFSTSFCRRERCFWAPLWLPKASASSRSCLLYSYFKSSNGHEEPWVRIPRVSIDSILDQQGCRLKSFTNCCFGQNSDPYPNGDLIYVWIALSKSFPHFSRTLVLSSAASLVR